MRHNLPCDVHLRNLILYLMSTVNQIFLHMPTKSSLIFYNYRERGCTKLTITRSVPTKIPTENTPQKLWSRMNYLDIISRFFLEVSHGISDDNLRQWVHHHYICLKSWTCSLHKHYPFSAEVALVRILGMFQWLYSLDRYASLDVASINSLVNKQANARLQRISNSLLHTLLHVKIFLGLQNRDKHSKLDVGS